jgi:hypothetical protein
MTQMKYNERTYFTEEAHEQVDGFTIIGTDENEGYHVAERYKDTFTDYWVPAAELHRRVRKGHCEPYCPLPVEDYEDMLEEVEHDGVHAEAV